MSTGCQKTIFQYVNMSTCQHVNMSVCQYVRMQLFSLGIKMKVVQNVINKDVRRSVSRCQETSMDSQRDRSWFFFTETPTTEPALPAIYQPTTQAKPQGITININNTPCLVRINFLN